MMKPIWHYMNQTAPRRGHVEAEPPPPLQFDEFDKLAYEAGMRQVIATPRLTIEQLQPRPVDTVLHYPTNGVPEA